MAATPATVNVNGRITDERQAVIPVFDHGFLYGEGVYEVLRTYNARPFLLDRHLSRLRRSADMIALDVPLTDGQFADRITETVVRAAQGPGSPGEWYVRILLTRGVGDLSYDPTACSSPSVVIIVKPHIDPPEHLYVRGVRVVMSSIVRNHPDTVNPMIKSNNLLNNALAMREAFARGASEVIMRNYRGEIAECAQSNLFVVKNGVALTPPLNAGLLPGITREFMWEVGRAAGITVGEAVMFDRDLLSADEMFLTSTTRELMPVVDLDDQRIGSGAPGAVTRTLLETFRRMARAQPA